MDAALDYPDDGTYTPVSPSSPFDLAFAEAQEAEADLGSVIATLEQRLTDYLRPEPSEALDGRAVLAEVDARSSAVARMHSHSAALRAKADRLRTILRLLDL